MAAIIHTDGSPVLTEEIQKLTDFVVHRGPNSQGTLTNGTVGLGHRRLSILDLIEDGSQPMAFQDKYEVVFNGEIYNYIEIRNELIKKGYQFTSGTDTEVLLKAYDFYGKDCLQQFNGMWSFVLLDKQKKQLFCSRDRFGIKPFYYCVQANQVVIGSEIKQIAQYLNMHKVNLPVLMDYLILGYEDYGEETCFQDIHQLLPANWMTIDLDSNQINIQSYYEPKLDAYVSKQDEVSSIQHFKELLYDSVKLRMRADVQVGGCLSGGLDSSSITAFAGPIFHHQHGGKFQAIHAGSTEKSQDESEYAKIVAKSAGTTLEIFKPNSSDFEKLMDDVIWSQDQPFGSMSILMQYMVMEKAKKIGNIVMLDGQCGDEILLGYERFYPLFMQGLGIYGSWQFSKHSKLTMFKSLLYNIYFKNASIRALRLRLNHSYLSNNSLGAANYKLLTEFSDAYKNLISLQKLELRSLQLPHLLRYEDRNSMAHGVEARLPLLDYRVVEFALSLNPEFKIKEGWSKYALRKSMEGTLPDEIVWRTNKIGFESPMITYFKQKDIQQELSRSELIQSLCKRSFSINNFSASIKWKLLNIARWESLYKMTLN